MYHDIRQIKLNSKALADSLSLVVSSNYFKDMASSFSINRSNVGGLMDPFERGKFNALGEKAFSLGVGDISGVIENLDKTFSIIMLPCICFWRRPARSGPYLI